jgi:hypothetical protein
MNQLIKQLRNDYGIVEEGQTFHPMLLYSKYFTPINPFYYDFHKVPLFFLLHWKFFALISYYAPSKFSMYL